MLIFIDESGNFTFAPSGKRNLSCVGALVIPEAPTARPVWSSRLMSKSGPPSSRESRSSFSTGVGNSASRKRGSLSMCMLVSCICQGMLAQPFGRTTNEH